MMSNEYTAARETLNWTHGQIGGAIGLKERVLYRYANGQPIPEPQRRLLRLLVFLRLTRDEKEFNDIVKQLD